MTASRMTVTQTRFQNGLWEAVLTGAASAPALEASHQGRALAGLTVNPISGEAGSHAVQLPIPASVIGEGVQTVLLQSRGETLASITFVAGAPLEEDLRAEISLLRAELDLLKRAFRRHVVETAG